VAVLPAKKCLTVIATANAAGEKFLSGSERRERPTDRREDIVMARRVGRTVLTIHQMAGEIDKWPKITCGG
jgi:hypothetical protein